MTDFRNFSLICTKSIAHNLFLILLYFAKKNKYDIIYYQTLHNKWNKELSFISFLVSSIEDNI